MESIQNQPKSNKIKPGGIIIQKWDTKNNVPPDVDNLSLPIIVDKRKLLSSIAMERALTEENVRKESSVDKYPQRNMRKLLLKMESKNEKMTRNLNTEPSHQYLHTGESTHSMLIK
jgi:hypothetical protein